MLPRPLFIVVIITTDLESVILFTILSARHIMADGLQLA